MPSGLRLRSQGPNPVSAKTCVVATAGCYEGHYCPYGNFPVDVVSPELYDNFNCIDNETDIYDCCYVNATTGFIECRCTPGFYCPLNTSQPQYCFPGYYCPTPHEIYVCPSGHYCPGATIEPIECTTLETCDTGAEQPERILLLFVFVIGLLVVLLLFKLVGHFVKTTNARADSELSGYHADRVHALAVLAAHAEMDHLPEEYVRRRKHGVTQCHDMLKKQSGVKHDAAGHIIIGDVLYDDAGANAANDPDAGVVAPPIIQGGASASPTAGEAAYAKADPREFVDALPDHHEFEIEFTDLGLKLPNGVVIMEGVTGMFAPGRSCAVMGPSGAGKTTVMSLITGKVQKTHGKIFVNSHEVSGLKAWEKEIGYVPQEDIMHRDLTVRQNIEFSAKLRLPSQWTAAEIHNHVDWIIDTLELTHVQHSIIGDELHRGVSGGQRKRVNIGIELAAMPSVLFLDEPTSGLDSTTATEVCTLLRRLAEEHRLTVIAVVHSPTPVAFAQFHDLLLLQKGGRTGYFGPREEAVGRMMDGYKYAACRADESPADYLLDVVSHRVHRTPGDDEIKLADIHEDITLADLHLAWIHHEQVHGHKADFDEVPLEVNGVHHHRMHKRRLKLIGAGLTRMEHAAVHAAHEEWDKMKHWFHAIKVDVHTWVLTAIRLVTKHGQHPIEQETVPRVTAGYAKQFWLCTQRAFRQNFSNFTDWFLGQLLHLGLGLGLAIPLSSLRFVGPYPRIICYFVSSPIMISKCVRPEIDAFSTGATTLGMAICFAGIATSVYTFGGEKAIYWRECQAGLSTVAYFMGKMLVDVLRLVIAAAMFFVGFLMMYSTQGSYNDLFTVILGYYTFGWALGYILSMAVPVESAPMAGVAAAVIWCILFGGITPSLREVNDEKGVYNDLRFLWDLSGPRWFNEAYYINEISYYGKNPLNESAPYVNLTTAYSMHDYDQDNFDASIGYGYLLAVGWAVLSLIVMMITNLDRKK